MAGELLPLTAIDDNLSSEALDADANGVYTVVDYYRNDGSLYIKSTLSNPDSNQNYQTVTLSFYENTGTSVLYEQVWTLGYDINRKIVSKKVT